MTSRQSALRSGSQTGNGLRHAARQFGDGDGDGNPPLAGLRPRNAPGGRTGPLQRIRTHLPCSTSSGHLGHCLVTGSRRRCLGHTAVAPLRRSLTVPFGLRFVVVTALGAELCCAAEGRWDPRRDSKCRKNSTYHRRCPKLLCSGGEIDSDLSPLIASPACRTLVFEGVGVDVPLQALHHGDSSLL